MQTEFLILVPIVVGLVQVAKISKLSHRWLPLLSLGLGVLGTFLVGAESFSQEVLQGLVVGLSASGLFDVGSKTVLNK